MFLRAATDTRPVPRPACDEILAQSGELGALPTFAARALEAVEARADAARLGFAIGLDAELTAFVLREANRPQFGSPRKVHRVAEAIAIIGLDDLGRCLAERLRPLASAPVRFLARALARRNLGRALAAEACAAEVGGVPYANAYTCALLLDLGKGALYHASPDAYPSLWRLEATMGVPSHELERARYDVDHAEVGAELCRRWNLPEAYELSIRHLHDPRAAAGLRKEVRRLFQVVLFARMLTTAVGLGPTPPRPTETLEEHPIARALGAGREVIARMEAAAQGGLAPFAEVFAPAA
jgi:HD-like signal output (HDOD) protein